MTTMAGVYFSVAVTLTTDMIKHLIIASRKGQKIKQEETVCVWSHCEELVIICK